jgi:hypothetical protein
MNRNTKKQPSSQTPKKPFFARFLEQQKLQDVTGGGGAVTTKFPSDDDETSTS